MLIKLVGGTADRTIAQTNCTSLQARAVFDKFANFADEIGLSAARIIIDGKHYYDRRGFYDMVHTVNEYSTRNGGAQVF